MALVVIDAGHGGANPGAVYNGRQEKDDALRLATAVGQILENNGVDVYYTRTSDIYESPSQKAQEGNAVQGDYFVSIHRNSSPYPNQYTGVESLVRNRYGEAARPAGAGGLRESGSERADRSGSAEPDTDAGGTAGTGIYQFRCRQSAA